MPLQLPTVACLRALLWKEYRDWRWAFLLYFGCLLFSLTYDLGYAGNTADPIPAFCLWCLLWGMFVPVLIGVRLSCSDAARNTLGFTTSLPCSLRTVAGMRLVSGLLMLIGPPLFASLLLLAYLFTGLRSELPRMFQGNPHWILDFGTGLTLMWSEQFALLLLIAVIGAKRKSEAQVGAYGAAIAVFFLVLRVILLSMRVTGQGPYYLLPSTIMQARGISADTNIAQLNFVAPVRGPLLLYLVIIAGLSVWFVLRYGGKPNFSSEIPESSWFGVRTLSPSIIRPTSPLSALIWINLRQALPLMVAGWLLAIPLMQFAALMRDQSLWAQPAALFEQSMVVIGALWPAVIGAGIFASDLRSSLGHFWRSRPISTQTWFWVKYVVGLTVVILALDIVPFLVLIASVIVQIIAQGLPAGYVIRHFNMISLTYSASYALIHVGCYTMAVLGVCWLRRPTLVAAICLPILLTAEEMMGRDYRWAQYSPTRLAESLLRANQMGHDVWRMFGTKYVVTYGTILALTCLAAWGASRAARRNVVQDLSSPLRTLWERLWRKSTAAPLALESSSGRD